MISAHNQRSNPSFEDVSKLFPLPLSEAADILGVSTSALKKICNENGLERWPHRKYLAGRSIEDIKKEAAKEKSKAQGGIIQANRQRGNLTTGSASSSPNGSSVKDKLPRSFPETSKPQTNSQQPANRSVITWRTHHTVASGSTVETSSCLDEFKYGFPSSGLSRSTNKWWGGASNGRDGVTKEDLNTGSGVKHTSQSEVDYSSTTLCEEKADAEMGDSICEEKVSLSAVRKRALDEGRKALKLGVLKKYGADKLGKEDMVLLHHLFQTSFPVNDSGAISQSGH